jgi:hypothetical protein
MEVAMSDKARKLAMELREMHGINVCGEAWQELELDLDQSIALIDAALKAARLEAVEECKKAWRRVWMSPTTNYGDILGEIDRALDELKEDIR